MNVFLTCISLVLQILVRSHNHELFYNYVFLIYTFNLFLNSAIYLSERLNQT